MKTRICSFLLALALLLTALPVPVRAASARIPIYVGDLKVDYLAESLLADMELDGKSDLEQIETVYDWIVHNCTRQASEWDGTYYFDEAEVARLSSGAFAQTYQANLHAGNILLRQEYRELSGIPNTEPGNWDSDSNNYVITSAYEMMRTRNGHCGNFSALLAVLLGHLGYDTRLVYGDFVSKFGGDPVVHTWNYILIDGVYYWADVRIDHSNISAGHATGGHDYFLIEDTDKWMEEHLWVPDYTEWLADNAWWIQSELDQAAADMGTPWDLCSEWAGDYMRQAGDMGLIPAVLDYQDLTRQITRAEFAAVAVRLYEVLTWEPVEYRGANPFTDTDNGDVLRAYSLGVVNGMGDGTFAPDSPLTREQAVTMLGRVYELVLTNGISGGEALPREQVLSFTDHWNISDYAKNYVYFFAGQSIVDGMGDGSFAPKRNMTREQAIKVAAVTAGTLG